MDRDRLVSTRPKLAGAVGAAATPATGFSYRWESSWWRHRSGCVEVKKSLGSVSKQKGAEKKS